MSTIRPRFTDAQAEVVRSMLTVYATRLQSQRRRAVAARALNELLAAIELAKLRSSTRRNTVSTTTTYTISEAAHLLDMTPDALLDFDQSLGGDWQHEFTPAEIEQLRHVLANLDESGAYTGEGTSS